MPISKASSNAVAAATKGDLVVGNATNDSGVLPIGTTGQILTVAAGTAAWATPATPITTKSYSLLSTTSMSGSSTITISGISNVDDIMVLLDDVGTASGDEMVRIRLNGSSANEYKFFGNSIFPSLSPVTAQNISNFNGNVESAISVFARSNGTGSVGNGAVRISGCNTTGIKVYTSTGGASALSGQQQQRIMNIQGVWNNAAKVTSVQIINDFGRTFNSGSIYVYVAA
jgi:hypothetical protein